MVDPTGTPLNIRIVKGEILSKAENVQIAKEIERNGAYKLMSPV